MKNQSIRTSLVVCTGILILILDSKTAISGAKDGIDLCLRTVIPSLFPFFLMSNLLTESLMGVEFRILRPIGRLFGLHKGTESMLIPAFLGGYPAGAQSISQAYRSGHLSKDNAERLLSWCNNAGPAFLFGMIGPMFPSSGYAWALWSIHILSAFLVSKTFPTPVESSQIVPSQTRGITEAMISSLRAIATVCGWVTVFRVLIAFLNRWVLWLLPVTAQVTIAGLLELSNGCCSLGLIDNIPVRFALCSCLLAFGGLCVTMQTSSAAMGLSIKYYLAGKALQTLFSLLICLCIRYTWIILPASCVYFLLWIGKLRINSRNSVTIGV